MWKIDYKNNDSLKKALLREAYLFVKRYKLNDG